MVEIIEFEGEKYPAFQSKGFASKFAFPYAKEVCKGSGLDIGCGQYDWCLPGAYPIDPKCGVKMDFHATYLPESPFHITEIVGAKDGIRIHEFQKREIDNVELGWDFLFSSHCLEHLNNWVFVLDYWRSILKEGGILFLYLPDFSQKYWRPFYNRKHIHSFTPEIIKSYFEAREFKNIFCSGVDLNNSFMIFGEK